ncbi:unnamed protein product [Heterobilharzia americana]|nr:unnamed protein product [Heterobilharzia americana]
MEQETNVVKPIRCLFTPLENKLNSNLRNSNSSEVSRRIINQRILTQICQKNVEEFRQCYNFDLNLMKPVDTENNNDHHESDQENQREAQSTYKYLCHQQRSDQKQTHKQIWNWEELDSRKTYIPPFYLSSGYHSDSYLLQPDCVRSSVPPNTPCKGTVKSFRNCSGNKLDSSHVFVSQGSLVSSETDETEPQQANPLTCNSLPSVLPVLRVNSRRIRQTLYETGLSIRTSKHANDVLVRSKSEEMVGQKNNSQPVEHFNHSTFIYSTHLLLENSAQSQSRNDEAFVNKVGACLNPDKKMNTASTVSRNSNLRQLKLTDIFPVYKTVKSCRPCLNP